jgi:DNA-binding CsgD family transcriptional regulator
VPTVNFHTRNLREKLGAHSKHQAVLTALRRGLL